MNGGGGAGAGGPHFLISDIGSSACQDEGEIKLVQRGASIQYDVGLPPQRRERGKRRFWPEQIDESFSASGIRQNCW
jgi:hypothetical protein